MSKLELYKNPSLVEANTSEAVEQILMRKAEEYSYNEAKLLDYIGNAKNILKDKQNTAYLKKQESENEIKMLSNLEDEIDKNIATALLSLGIDLLSDKTANICSSISITEAIEETKELKERSLTASEMKTLLKANGLSSVAVEEVLVPAKPATIKVNYKKGKGVKKLTKKDTETILIKRLVDENIS